MGEDFSQLLFKLLIKAKFIILCSAALSIIPHGNHNEDTSLLLECKISSFVNVASWTSSNFIRDCISDGQCLGRDDTNHEVFSNNTGIYLYIKRLVITEEDNRNWTCSHNGILRTYIVLIKIPLETVSLLPNATVDLMNGQIQDFKCSARSRPVSVLSWHIGKSFSPTTATPPSNNLIGDTVMSTLSYQAQKQENNMTLYCTAYNGNDVITEGVVLNIMYAPTASVSPEYNPYNVIENTTNVELLCNAADANPMATSYTWYHNESLLPERDRALIFSVVRQSDSGSYKCSATNIVGISQPSAVIYMNVLYGVLVNPISSQQLLEGSGLSLTCIGLSNPHMADTDVIWTKQNNDSFRKTGKFEIKSLNRLDSGNYTCSVIKTLIPSTGKAVNVTGKANFQIDVLYGVNLNSVERQISVEGSEVRVICNGQSYPPISDDEIKWTKQGNTTFRRTGKNLIIKDVDKLDSGFYICSVFKTLTPSIGLPVNVSATAFVELYVNAKCRCEIGSSSRTDAAIFKAGISSLIVGILMILSTIVGNVLYRTRLAKGKETSRCNEYAQVKSNNPAFTGEYDTLDQDKPTDTSTNQPAASTDNNTYEEIQQNTKLHVHVHKGLEDLGKDCAEKEKSVYANVNC